MIQRRDFILGIMFCEYKLLSIQAVCDPSNIPCPQSVHTYKLLSLIMSTSKMGFAHVLVDFLLHYWNIYLHMISFVAFHPLIYFVVNTGWTLPSCHSIIGRQRGCSWNKWSARSVWGSILASEHCHIYLALSHSLSAPLTLGHIHLWSLCNV